MMKKYLIKFTFDIESEVEYDAYEQDIEILDLNDSEFDNVFNSDKKIKKFQDWYNYDKDDSEKVNLIDIEYEREYEDSGMIHVASTTEIKNADDFADYLLAYLFDNATATVYYHVTGTRNEDYWDGVRSSPGQRNVYVDYDDDAKINHYSDVEIKEV